MKNNRQTQGNENVTPLQLINENKRKRFEAAKKYLIDHASEWDNDDKVMWCLENDLHIQTTNKYLRGEIGSIIIAEMLVEYLKKYFVNKKLVA